ncbi:MAG: hypothetical protein ABIJ82_02185 [Patescibacteria group bacterium]|nr:DUF4352 domain-containing protein [Patescibacteria group bacterium]MBU1952849.1 DUF4352 domain-containing protein [Patescibacteria group bacterium]
MFKNKENTGNKTVREMSLKTVIGYIFNALILIFFIFSGVVTVKAGQLVVGILYYVLAALVVVPHHRLRVTKSLKFVILVILFFILTIISGVNNTPDKQKYDYFTLAQEFNLKYGGNTYSIVVKDVRQETKIIVQQKEVTTSGYFLIVRADIVNLGSESIDFKLGKNPELIDNQDRRYTLYGSNIPAGKLQPSVAKEVSYFFEIPKDASGLKFIIKDGSVVAKSIDLKR